MKKFDEVNNILVDVSWRFTTVIIIDCIVFISICLCLISAIRSYNKNAKLQLHTNVDAVQGALKSHNLIKDNEEIEPLYFEEEFDINQLIDIIKTDYDSEEVASSNLDCAGGYEI